MIKSTSTYISSEAILHSRQIQMDKKNYRIDAYRWEEFYQKKSYF